MTITTRLGDELKWLIAHPEFEERPATLEEFLGEDYLNIRSRVRLAVLEELKKIVGDDIRTDRPTLYPKAMFTGGIGIGKTTIASIVLTYLAHWVLCLKDPQGFFGLLPGSRIAFMQMSTSETQAKEVVFGDVKARIEYSKWFRTKYPHDPAFKNQLRFPKDIWIIPGDSSETTFEGYNILGGILDEADSHKLTKVKDYAEQGYTTIHTRITSRFEDRGFIMVIGQMKRANGFAARKFQEYKRDPQAYARRMSIWESLGWDHYLKPDGTRDSFWYDADRKEIVPTGIATMLDADNLIEVPNVFRRDFENNPEKALRDLAGIPPLTGSPFISLTYKITESRNRFITMYGDFRPVDEKGRFHRDFYAANTLPRVVHLDMAYSPEGDALGLAMGHVPEVIEIDGERKPFIVFDLLLRIHAPAGREIFLGDVRRVIYELKDDRKFKIKKVTMDGFQSQDTKQQLERRRLETEIVSVDKQVMPYHDLREAIYENRVAFPKYLVRLRSDDVELTEIAFKELSELIDDGDKINHPEEGSKDVADAMAGVTYTLMGDRRYRRRMRVDSLSGDQPKDLTPAAGRPMTTALPMSVPTPPTGDVLWNPPIRRR